MSHTKIDKVGQFIYPSYTTKIPQESQETKQIRKTGLEIDLIKAQTELIKEGASLPTMTQDNSFYLKKLNII